jgi:hypothetical protein
MLLRETCEKLREKAFAERRHLCLRFAGILPGCLPRPFASKDAREPHAGCMRSTCHYFNLKLRAIMSV